MADKPGDADEAEANEADKAEADEADEAIEEVEKVRSLLVDDIAIVLYLVFSLTKYSVIFTEVEGDFEKSYNQLGTDVVGLDKLVAAKSHDELDELVVTKGHDELNELVVAVRHLRPKAK